jgi:hypothetical protein
MIAEGLVRIYELEEGDKFEMLGHRYTVKKINAEIMYFKLSDFAGAELRTMSHGSYQLVTLIK